MEQGWVALLRGINVGSRNRVPMAGLREALEAAGCNSVSTYIQSGNVVFTKQTSDRKALARRLERAVEEAFGVKSVVVLRTFSELRKLARSHPFGDDSSRTYVVFLAETPPRAAVRRLKERNVGPDRYEVVGQDVFVHYPTGLQGGRLSAAALERALEVAGTMRNWRTVTRLAELATA